MENCEYKKRPDSIADILEKIKAEQYAEWSERAIGQFVSDHSGGRKCDHNATEMRPSFISDHSGGANKMVDHVSDAGKMVDHIPDTTKMMPLTLEQLRKMDGKPVLYKRTNQWFIVQLNHPDFGDCIITQSGYFLPLETAAERGLYAYPPAHIDLEAWTAEWVDNDESEEMMCKCSKCGYPVSYFWGKTGFCPGCGKAMTPEALAMLEKRLRG